MATYKSSHKGSQIDEAVTIANTNLGKGSDELPIYYDANGLAQTVSTSSTVTVSSTEMLTSGGAYTGLNAVVDNSDVQLVLESGSVTGYTKEGTPTISEGVASNFSASNYLHKEFSNYTISNSLTLEYTLTFSSVNTGRNQFPVKVYRTLTDNHYILNFRKLGGSAKTFSFIARNPSDTSTVVTPEFEIQYGVPTKIKVVYIGSTAKFYIDDVLKSELTGLYNISNIPLARIDMGTQYPDLATYFPGSIDLKTVKIYVDGNLYYTPLGNSSLPPSQNAVKQYVDNSLPAKQDTLYGGYGIDVNGATVSVSDDVFRENEEARIHADLKVDHFGDMSVGNDSDVLSKMEAAKRSTFDLSKFTKVGSPIVTSDGIASGFAQINYIRITNVQYASTTSFELAYPKVKFTNTSTAQTISEWGDSTNTRAMNALINGSLVTIVYRGASTILRYDIENVSTSSWYQTKIVWDGASYKIYYRIDDGEWTLGDSQADTTAPMFTANYCFLGVNNVTLNPLTYGSIDLKQFSIAVDGVEVLSGNKTGIDTIKPDDYTVVGTPTISADGIASGFSTSSYIKTPTLNLDSNNWVLECDFIVTGSTETPIVVGSDTGEVKLATAWISDTNIRLAMSSNGSSWDIANNLSIPANIPSNTKNSIKLLFNGTQYLLYVNGTLVKTIDSTSKIYTASTTVFTLGVHRNKTSALEGSIDLNAFKIYVDGNLVYQPCLKIPYTLSKDGNKIVDNFYRPRVEDEYTQAGYTPYYTLQQELGDNYTVVGSPTISANGIASGFSSSNYLKKENLIPLTFNELIIKCKFRTTSVSTYDAIFSLYTPSATQKTNLIFNYNKISLTSGDTVFAVLTSTNNWIANTEYSAKTRINVALNKIFLDIYNPDGTVFYSNETAITTALDTTKTFSLLLGVQPGAAYPLTNGSIDLNAFKIYIDNKLVYTAGRNYTLPTVEQNDIVEEYLSGVTSYIQRADLSIEQQGTTTSGTTVTFPKAFIDTNYALSLPYSAKTVTGFTAAADGDYMAEGYTSL